MKMKKNILFIFMIAITAFTTLAFADYSEILTNNEEAVNAIQTGASPWFKAFIAMIPVIAFIGGIAATIAYHWQKAEEQRKDKLKISFIAVAAGFVLAWAAYATSDAIVSFATGRENAAKTVINEWWATVFGL